VSSQWIENDNRGGHVEWTCDMCGDTVESQILPRNWSCVRVIVEHIGQITRRTGLTRGIDGLIKYEFNKIHACSRPCMDALLAEAGPAIRKAQSERLSDPRTECEELSKMQATR